MSGPQLRQCEAVTFYGSRNPDSHNFGPTEYCEREYEDDGDAYCPYHREGDDW